MEKNKKVHFIGICGTAMAACAVELKNMNFDICGSDKGFYPPVSVYLESNNIKIEIGYKKNHITDDIDFVVLGNAVSISNIELKEAQRKNIKIYSYPEILEKFLVKKESIVVAGEYGKTTITSLLSYIFTKAGKKPSYMFGGISLDLKESMKIEDSDISIIEGDEYNASSLDKSSKFLYYKPKYLILTSLLWDHIDLFPKEEDYINTFKKLVSLVPKDGMIILNIDDKSIEKILPLDKNIKTYSLKDQNADFAVSSIDILGGVTQFEINNKYIFKTTLIGRHNIQNLTAGIALSLSLGLDYEDIKKAVLDYKGPKRRLEVRYKGEKGIVIDDFAHSPYKVKASVEAVREYFSSKKIISIYEPHSMSARDKKTLMWYKDIFIGSDKVIIVDIYKKNALDEEKRLESNDIVDIVKLDVKDSVYVKNSDLVEYLKKEFSKDTVFLFMSTGSFQGMLSKFVENL